MKKLILLCGMMVSVAVLAEKTIEATWPNLEIYHQSGEKVEGITDSQTERKVVEKVFGLPCGEYEIVRPTVFATVQGCPVVTPPPPPVDDDDDGVLDDVDQCLDSAPDAVVDPMTGCDVVVVPPPTGSVSCPDEPTWTNDGRYEWFLCNIPATGDLSAYGTDYKMSYMTPKPVNFGDDNPTRLVVYMHPSSFDSQFVTGRSSFNFPLNQKQIEFHIQEDKYRVTPSDPIMGGESWWVYSGAQVGNIKNFNGNRIAATIDHLKEKYGDALDLDKGITLTGTSLGGAGAFHQAMVLPKYQDKVAIAVSFWGRTMIPKHPGYISRGWGDDLFDTVDIRTQWDKVENVHFHWAGGENDTFQRHDPEFLDICELRKISCSFAWLQSGHGFTETGYSVDKKLWLDPNQDVTLDKVLPVITNNSSNYRGDLRGIHNRGITWHHGNISDTSDEIQVPLQYVAAKNMGPDLPDQPDTVTFSLTLRHVKNLDMSGGVDWVFGDQSGSVAMGSDGLITIDGLTLDSGVGYTVLVVKKQ